MSTYRVTVRIEELGIGNRVVSSAEATHDHHAGGNPRFRYSEATKAVEPAAERAVQMFAAAKADPLADSA